MKGKGKLLTRDQTVRLGIISAVDRNELLKLIVADLQRRSTNQHRGYKKRNATKARNHKRRRFEQAPARLAPIVEALIHAPLRGR